MSSQKSLDENDKHKHYKETWLAVEEAKIQDSAVEVDEWASW
jgi:hypothetical protein